MNILFLFIFLPDLSEKGAFADLIKEFAKQGHYVKVATPLNKGSVTGVNKEAGVDVLRFKTDQLTNNKSNLQKGIAYIKLIYQYNKAIKHYYGKEKFDLIIAHSLPAEIGIIVKLLKKKFKSKFYLILNEYIWQDSVSLGFFKKGGLICKYYRKLENVTIQVADYIGSPSKGNIDFTLKYHPSAIEKNIHLIHYAKAPTYPMKSHNDLREKYNLNGKFVAVYGGNMSIAQKIENIIDLAEQCLIYDDICFVLLGKGQDVENTKIEVTKRNLTNVVFIDFLPQEEYFQLLSVCDVGLISLNEKLAVPNIPSKTLDYFNLKIPIVASIDKTTDYGTYLEEAGAGLWSFAGDTKKFKENLLKLYNYPELKVNMGHNGYRFYMENMLPEKAYYTIINQIKKII